MAIVTTDSKHYTNIAKAIREKTGATTQYKPAEMPGGIAEVYTKGHTEGHSAGYDAGYEAGCEAGGGELPDGDEVSY